MSPRRSRRRPAPGAERDPAAPAGVDRLAEWGAQEYVVRQLAGAGAGKSYRCPGCDQEIRPGTPHVVVWPVGDPDAADRRHWHTACWRARDRRRSRLLRSGRGPRY